MEKTISNSFLIGSGIKKLILDAFGAATTNESFNWNLDDFISWIKKDESVSKEFDIYKLSRDEMILLGFGVVKDTDCLAIPAWIYQFLPDELAVVPGGSTEYVVVEKSSMDKEAVNGCLKYGVYPSDFDRNSIKN